MNKKIIDIAKNAALALVALQLLFSPLIYLAVLNAVGPSTEYHNPAIGTAVKGPDGSSYVYLGDELYVWITIIRHKLNGNCRFEIERFAEAVGGSRDGQKYMISKTALQFVGQNELRRTRWPVPSEKYILGYGVNEKNEPQIDQPLLPDGIDEQEFTFYVVGQYFCNALDYVIPRYIQGGDRPDITPRVNAVLRRQKP